MSAARAEYGVHAEVNADGGSCADAPRRGRLGGSPEDAPTQARFSEWAMGIRPRLISAAYRLLWNASDAEEVAQDALALAWQHAGDPAVANRDAWTFRTVINLCHNRRRRRRDEPITTEPSGRSATAAPAEQGEIAERLRLAVTRLPDRQQAAIVLRELEGMGYPELAAVLETTESGARLIVHRARLALREILLRQWPEVFGEPT